MSQEKGETDAIAESVQEKDEPENGGTPPSSSSDDELLQMIAELRLENDFLRSQFKEQTEVDSSQVKQLEERLESLSREIDVEKQTRVAAEQALEHLREAYSEADAKAQEYSTKFSQGWFASPFIFPTRICFQFFFFIFLSLFCCCVVQQKLDQEIKEREEKYADLDAKFTRLHKRAKQRIQEIQKASSPSP